MSQVLDSGLGERTLGALGVQLMLTKKSKDSAQMLHMLLQGMAEHQNVIQKRDDKLTVWAGEDIIYQALECWWSIGDAERHDTELKMSVMGLECYLLLITFAHPNLMVASAQIDLGEDCCTG